ncbi:MAG: MBL fold metallo-hydrolase, partial [Chloroflexota bacterium]|nr:MBL fold metallo-hydrolase [Chloroflexota bacterium]
MVTGEKSPIMNLRPGIYLIPGERPGSHTYLVKGLDKNVLIDTGTAAGFPTLKKRLRALGIRRQDIHLVILSHEHFDHIGAAAFFTGAAVIGAHRLAANKIELQDEFVTMNKYFNVANRQFRVDLWLEDGCLIDVGNYKLEVIHTPGHTSGCICLYEPDHKFLFSGDTVFANGTLSEVAASGSISDYVGSLQRLSSLHISELYPAHGKTSLAPE